MIIDIWTPASHRVELSIYVSYYRHMWFLWQRRHQKKQESDFKAIHRYPFYTYYQSSNVCGILLLRDHCGDWMSSVWNEGNFITLQLFGRIWQKSWQTFLARPRKIPHTLQKPHQRHQGWHGPWRYVLQPYFSKEDNTFFRERRWQTTLNREITSVME